MSLVFVDCASIAQDGSHLHAAPCRRVMRGEQEIRTIDVHAHCVFPDAMALMNIDLSTLPSRIAPPVLRTDDEQIGARLAAMDALGIVTQILSVNPFWYGAERDLADRIVQMQNIALAGIVERHPHRFAAFATIALQHPDLATDQLDYAVSELGLKGALVGANVAGVELSDPRFHPFWAKAEALGTPIFIHPQPGGEWAPRLRGAGALGNVIGSPLDTTIAILHLICEGTLDRFPGLKLLTAHGGGYLTAQIARADAVQATLGLEGEPPLRKAPSEYLKDLYYDSLVLSREALRRLIAQVGADRIMVGTDFPYPWTKDPIGDVLAVEGLSAEERIGMLGAVAERLFRL